MVPCDGLVSFTWGAAILSVTSFDRNRKERPWALVVAVPIFPSTLVAVVLLICVIQPLFSLLLEISPPCPTVWDNVSAESAFETAVHSPLDRQDVQTLWTEYLLYQRSKFMQREKSFTPHQQHMSELVNRCLMSVSTSSSFPFSSSAVWQDYRFHNQVKNQ